MKTKLITLLLILAALATSAYDDPGFPPPDTLPPVAELSLDDNIAPPIHERIPSSDVPAVTVPQPPADAPPPPGWENAQPAPVIALPADNAPPTGEK